MRSKRAEQTGTLIGVRLQPDALDVLDKWRDSQADSPSRPEAIRRLLAIAAQDRRQASR